MRIGGASPPGSMERGRVDKGRRESRVEGVEGGIEKVADPGNVDARVPGIGMVAVHDKDEGSEQERAEGRGWIAAADGSGIAHR